MGTKKDILPNSFFEVRIIKTKDIVKNKTYRLMSLMNIDEKILNKILANWSQQCSKSILHHKQVRVIPRLQESFNIQKLVKVVHHINKLTKKKKHMIISKDAEKAFDKIQEWFVYRR